MNDIDVIIIVLNVMFQMKLAIFAFNSWANDSPHRRHWNCFGQFYGKDMIYVEFVTLVKRIILRTIGYYYIQFSIHWRVV